MSTATRRSGSNGLASITLYLALLCAVNDLYTTGECGWISLAVSSLSLGAILVYRWRTTPPWERVEGIRKPKEDGIENAARGTYGFNGESNDAHDLLGYPARQHDRPADS